MSSPPLPCLAQVAKLAGAAARKAAEEGAGPEAVEKAATSTAMAADKAAVAAINAGATPAAAKAASEAAAAAVGSGQSAREAAKRAREAASAVHELLCRGFSILVNPRTVCRAVVRGRWCYRC